MVSASSDKPVTECDRMAFKDKLKRSVLLDINCQVDDTPVFTTSDGYKAHLKHLNKRLKSNGRDLHCVYDRAMLNRTQKHLSRK